MPDNNIALEIVRQLGHPLVTTSANITRQQTYEDPSLIEDEFGSQLDMVVDGGKLSGDPSTVVSLIDEEIEVLRHGCGDVSWIK